MKRLKIYVVLLTVVLLCTTIPGSLGSFMGGFTISYNKTQTEVATHSMVPLSFIFKYESGNSEIKEITFKDIHLPIEINRGYVTITRELLETAKGTLGYRLYWSYFFLVIVLCIPMLVGLIWILVLVLKLLNSVLTTKIFEYKNIVRISKIAYTLLAIEVINIIFCLLSVLCIQELFAIGNYKIDYMGIFQESTLVVIMIILVMNELLRIATTMKEEQELTI